MTSEEEAEAAAHILAGEKQCRVCGNWVKTYLGRKLKPKKVLCFPCWRQKLSEAQKRAYVERLKAVDGQLP